MQTALKSQMLLQFKLEEIPSLLESTPPVPSTPVFIDEGSAWSVGTHFGQGNAQFTTLGSAETEKTVVLGLEIIISTLGTSTSNGMVIS